VCKIITFLCRQKENALIKKLAKEEKRPVTLFDLEENGFNSRFRANRHRTLYIQNNRNNFKSYLNTYRYINRTIEEGKKMISGIIKLLIGIVVIVILIWIILAVVHAF